ncbi:MAG: hypothetical protein ABIS14_12735 [Sphingomonas sp.]
MFVQGFGKSVCEGDTIECVTDGFTATATIHRHGDDSNTPPWQNEDGHGPVSEWRSAENWHDGARPIKAPGELVLHEDGHGRRASFRLYDYAEACRIALRDGWGVSPYRLDVESGANGLKRANAQWFEGRELVAFRSDWSDDQSDAIAQVYAAHRATMTPRQYAAAAAMADFKRLRDWCNDEWQYVGVDVTVSRSGVQLVGQYSHALWGIESDSGDYLTETANELLDEALVTAREVVATLVA